MLSGGMFPLGRILMTPGAAELLDRVGQPFGVYLDRHARGDWGDLEPEDKAANDRAVAIGECILSCYTADEAGDQIWIITEADRSATTILLPDEY